MRQLLLPTLVAGVLMTAGAPTVAATDASGAMIVDGAFGTPVRALAGRFPYGFAMAVDAQGRSHLAAAGWHGGKGGLWYATDRSGGWVSRRLVRWRDGRYAVYPSIALDAAGRVHIAMARYGCLECTVAPALGIFYLTDAGRPPGSFPATPTRLTPVGTAQPSLRVDQGRRFLAYAGNPDAAPRAVRLLTDASGSWTTRTVSAHGTAPFLRIGRDGKPRITFEAADGLRYARATTRIGAFEIEPVEGTDGQDERPALSMDQNGGPHVTWVDPTGPDAIVRYARRTSSGWSAPATVADGQVHALTVDRPTRPWVIIGGSTVVAYRRVAGTFAALTVDDHAASAVSARVLDSGRVVVGWVGGSTPGLWVARS
jgi:hypothetical protein